MSYTPEEYLNKMRARLLNLKQLNLIAPVVTKLQSTMAKRIFDDGQSGNAQKIGAYSTRPMYATVKRFAKRGAFKPAGKSAKGASFKNGEPRRSMYLPQGYKQLKEVQGMEAGFVNLTYSGDLRNAFNGEPVVNAGTVTISLGGKGNTQKIKALTAKYGEGIFKPTPAERNFFTGEITRKILQTLST